MKGKWTIDQQLEIIKLKNNNVPIKNIMEIFDIKSKKSIYDIIDRNGREYVIANKKYSVNENYFDEIDNEEKAYWLGFLYADGCVRLKDNRSGELKLKLQKSDENHIELFNECLSSNYPIKNGFNKVLYGENKISISEYSAVSIYNTKLVKDLIKHGCVNNKTFKIQLPLLDDSLMRHFIRGYFDGDGCVCKYYTKNKSKYDYKISVLGNEHFIKSLQNYLIVKLNSDSRNIHNYKKGNIRSLSIFKNNECLKIKEYFYDESTIFLKRKKDIFDNLINNSL